MRAAVALGLALAAAVLPQVALDDGARHGDPPYLLEDGWTPLLNGKNLNGWRLQSPEKGGWAAVRGVSWGGAADPAALVPLAGPGDRIVNGPRGSVSNIVTNRKFGDVELYLEFLLAAKSNSGVYLHGLYEVQVLDSYGLKRLRFADCGGVYQRVVDGKGFGGRPPMVNASRPAGHWQSFHIWFRGPRFASGKKTENARLLRVLHNGVLVQQDVELDGPTHSAMDLPEGPENPLMLQGDHGPVAYRNVYVRPLRQQAR